MASLPTTCLCKHGIVICQEDIRWNNLKTKESTCLKWKKHEVYFIWIHYTILGNHGDRPHQVSARLPCVALLARIVANSRCTAARVQGCWRSSRDYMTTDRYVRGCSGVWWRPVVHLLGELAKRDGLWLAV
jgi:hypothetical protein